MKLDPVFRQWPLLAPVLAASSFVLTVYADQGALFFELVRPLGVAMAIAVGLQLGLTAVIRRPQAAAGLTLMLIAWLVDVRLILPSVAGYVALELLRRRGRRIHALPTVAAITILVFTSSGVRVVGSEAFDISDLRGGPTSEGTVRPGDPDIFLLLLDGYPRSDSLAELGYDNTWFEDELAARGFHMSPESRSAYPFTGLTVTSMLNMEHLLDIEGLYPAPPTHVGQTRALVEHSNESAVLRILEERGYWTASAGLTEVRGTIRNVDQYVDAGEIRFWERQVLQRTSIWEVLCDAVVIPQHRSLIESTFGAFEDVTATSPDAPVFMFAHVLSPHTPIVFDSNGGPVRTGSGACSDQFDIDATRIGLDSEAFAAAMADQVHFLNTRTLEALDQLLNSRPHATVVVFSDHGMRYSTEVTDEWFRSFFAARTPDHERLFPRDARPIDIFPMLFNAYFGADIPRADERAFTSVHGIHMPLNLAPWHPNPG